MEKKFTVDQKSLLSALSAMQPICTKRTTLDSTSSILFSIGHKELILKGTDLEISLQASCPIHESTLTQPEQFLVPGKRIFEVVKELDGTILFTLDNHQITLVAKGVNLSLNIKNIQEFPPFPERIENLMHLDSDAFVDMLNQVAFLIPQNNANPALNGLFLEISPDSLTMTTTDGHCLAQVKTKKYMLANPHSWLLPRRAIVELKKILESYHDQTVFFGTCGNQLVFSGELFNFFTKLLANSFPQYKPTLDKTDFVCSTIDRGQFIKTLRRSACLLSGQFLATRFAFSEDRLRVLMTNKDVGALDEEITIGHLPGGQIDTRFYAPYLLNGLQSFSGDMLTFHLKNSTKPIVFESESGETQTTYLVMPVAAIGNER